MQDFNMETVQKALVSLEAKIGNLESQLAAARAKRETLKGTIEYFNPTPKRASKNVVDIKVEPDELRGMELEEALVFIAQRNDDIVTNKSVRPLLVEAGVLHAKQISHKLSLTLTNSVYFEKERTGTYRLLQGLNYSF